MIKRSRWTICKPALRSEFGLIACQNPEAAQVGARILAEGGNAVDAAVTTALMLSVVEPWLSGIGGGGFLIFGDGQTGRTKALDFNMLSPAELNPEDYPLTENTDDDWFGWPAVVGERNLFGYSSICVPGAIDGLANALAELGTLDWADALAPAIEAAERGLIIDWYASMCIAIDAAGLARFPHSGETFLKGGCVPGSPDGRQRTTLPMPSKARLLRHLAKEGPRSFYEGSVARAMVADLQAGGSKITEKDFENYHSRWVSPLVGTYRGRMLHVIPRLSGGPSLLHALKHLEEAWIPAGNTPDADTAMAHAEALHAAYQHRFETLGHAGNQPGLTPDCTTHISVVDAQGNMVALTNTLLSRFGSKVVLPSAGILMNNAMMWFDPRPGRANSIAPATKPLANMCPVLEMTDGYPMLSIGAAGGRQIFPAIAQLLSFMADFGMDLETAFHAPRLDASSETVVLDARMHPSVAAAISRQFSTAIVEDTVYPVQFAIPTAVQRLEAYTPSYRPLFEGMAHPTSPWATVADGRRDGTCLRGEQ